MYDNVWLHHYYCYCGGIWSDSSLLQSIEVCRRSFMHSSLKVSMSVMLRSTHDWAIVAPWLFSFTTKGSLSWSMIQFRPSFSCQTDGLTFDSGILEVQTSGSAVGMSCVCWNVVFLVVWLHFLHFFPDTVMCIMAWHLHCGFICAKDIVSKVLWFTQMQLYREKAFSWQPFQL